MNKLFLWSVIAVPAATLSCRTKNNSSVKDVGMVNTQEANTKVLYADQNKVYLKACKPALAPPLTRSCASDETPRFLELPIYLSRLPYEVGKYQRTGEVKTDEDEQIKAGGGLGLVTKALKDAKQAVADGNQNASVIVAELSPIKLNLEKILKLRDNLALTQKDLTYYQYQDEFKKFTLPFSSTSENENYLTFYGTCGYTSNSPVPWSNHTSFPWTIKAADLGKATKLFEKNCQGYCTDPDGPIAINCHIKVISPNRCSVFPCPTS